MSNIVLECQAVEIETVAGRLIVKGVSFTLRKGEVLGLIGESGAGKTTLGMLALGHLRAGLRHVGGSMRFEGQDLLRLAPKALQNLRGRRIAYVAQSAAAGFNPALTLYTQITEPLRLDGVATGEIDAALAPLLAALGLPPLEVLAKRYPHQLSGGQLQRAMIAMALLPKPQVIVFDEPTTALDHVTQAEVVGAIKQAIALSGAAALYISHDLPLVMGLAHRVLVLRHGSVLEETEVASLAVNGARTDYAQRLMSAHVVPAARLPEVRVPVLSVRGLTIAHTNAAPIVRDFGFTLHRGETLALTGPSGSGKSSVLRAITGLMRPIAGDLLLEGEPLPPLASQRKKAQLAAVQIVHQIPDLALNPAHSVGFILGRGLRLAGKAPNLRDLTELMLAVELDPALLARQSGDLSGGQKQRICIARALAANPKVLICDEPTASLDPLVAQEVLATLTRLQERYGTACLFITHDRKLVESYAHREVALTVPAVL